MRGPGVFGGYHGEDPENARFDAEGYLASGDYATRDAEGFITLTGASRKTTREFSIENGELTPNLKLRRAAVEAAFQEPVERLYRLLETARGAPTQLEEDGGQVMLCGLGTVF